MYFDEISIGDKVVTRKRTITGSEIDLICAMTGLDLPGFLEDEFAKNYGFRARVCPGAYVMACAYGLLVEHGFLSHAIAWASSGEVRLKRPVHPGDRIYVEAEVLNKKETRHKDRGLITYTFVIKNQNDEEVIVTQNT